MDQLPYKEDGKDFKMSMSYTITIGNLNVFYLGIHDFFHKNYIQYRA